MAKPFLISHFSNRVIPKFEREDFIAKLVVVDNLQSFATDYVPNVLIPELTSYTTGEKTESNFYNIGNE